MSKGSARRPGSGYADGWSRIFEGKTAEERQAGGLVEWPTELQMIEFRRSSVAAMVQEKYPESDGYLGPRIHSNFRCKVNGQDMGMDSGFEVLTKIGMDYVLEAIELPDKTCQHCKYYVKEYSWFECINKEVVSMAKADYGPSFEPPADFCCNRWEKKE